MTNHLIFLPGLGDDKPERLLKLLNFWKIFGFRVHFQQMRWDDNESFDQKLQRALKLVDKLTTPNSSINLVGISAGASAAINVYSARKADISKVVFICGKLNNPNAIGQIYRRENPAFIKSIYAAQPKIKALGPLDKSKMLNVYPIYDNIVPVQDTKIPGVKNLLTLSALHTPSIVLGLSLYSPLIASFIKRKIP